MLEIERSFGVVIGDEQTGGKVLRSVDTIAEFIEAQREPLGLTACSRVRMARWRAQRLHRRRRGVVPHLRRGRAVGPAQWDALPSRVERRHGACSTLLEAHAAHRATFFVVGWVAERYPALVATIRAAGHEIGCTATAIAASTTSTPEAFASDLRGNRAALAAAGAAAVVTLFRAPEWSINDRPRGRSPILAEEGIRLDASRAAVAASDHRPSPGVRTRSRPRPDRFSRCRRWWPTGRAGGAARLGLGLAQAEPAARARGHRREQPAGRSGRAYGASMGDRSRSAARPAAAALAFAHYFRLSGFRARLREVLAGAEFGPLCELPDAEAWLHA